MYDVPDIIGELTHAEALPRQALKAASERHTELVGPLLAEIEQLLAAPESAQAKANLIFFAFHLLGEWRETTAYRPLARLLRMDSDRLDIIFGDGIIESAHRVMAAVFDGDPQPLYDLIRDTGADEFVRSRMCEALAMLVVGGRLPRPEVIDFLRETYLRRDHADDGAVWGGWQSTIAYIGATELTPLVREVFETELIHPSITNFDYFEQDLSRALSHQDEPWPWRRDNEYALWGNSIDELSTWYGFSEKHLEERKRSQIPIWERSAKDIAQALGEPLVNPFRNVGRNDPCPCGSGKKYKKCCLE